MHKIKQNYQLYLMVLPGLIYIIIYHYIPIYGAQIAFRNFLPALGIWGSPWTGFENFRTFFNSFASKTVIRNTLYLGVLSLFMSFPIPVILSLLLNQMKSHRYKKLVQTVTYAPYFISIVVLVGMLNIFLSPNYGIVNNIIVMLGGEAQLFMGNSLWFRPIYIISEIWQTTGWGMILYLATLSNVDVELYEASKIDGATKFQQILHIDLPVLVDVVIVVFIMRTGRIMNADFEKVFIMQNVLNLGVSEVIHTYVYKVGILQSNLSYSTAIGLFNSVINCFMLLLVNGLSRRISGKSLL